MTNTGECITGLLLLCAIGGAGYLLGTSRERAEWLAIPPGCFNLRVTVEGAGILTATGARTDLGRPAMENGK